MDQRSERGGGSRGRSGNRLKMDEFTTGGSFLKEVREKREMRRGRSRSPKERETRSSCVRLTAQRHSSGRMADELVHVDTVKQGNVEREGFC